MNLTERLKEEFKNPPKGQFYPHYFRAIGYRNGTHSSPSGKRADGIVSLFVEPTPYIYKNDLIVGSTRSLFMSPSQEEIKESEAAVALYPERTFIQNQDHFAPDFERVLSVGIGGLLASIAESEKQHAGETEALDFLDSMRASLGGLQERLQKHAKRARELMGTDGYDSERLAMIAENCESIVEKAPESFAQGLQLVWMIHSCFLYETRYAMALGRLDQYLYPLYCRDVEAGTLTQDGAIALLENALLKICERRFYLNVDDVVNICIGGVDPQTGKCAVNELSYCVLQAEKNINLPGPNLSARIPADVPDKFLDECLKSIGTGLGYPALMNDEVNMAALRRYGYEEVDVRNYSMVGCIENFITGMQPPWSDGRFDTPRFLEYVLFNGEGFDKNRTGIKTAPLDEITTMELFMKNLEAQIVHGVKEYVDGFYQGNVINDPENYTSPFLSCFCKDCIERGRDINMGGARYPSVHGAALMGVGTISDSLAAIEKVVFCDKEATLTELADAMRCNFEGYEALREKLLAAPKYGNNDDLWINTQSGSRPSCPISSISTAPTTEAASTSPWRQTQATFGQDIGSVQRPTADLPRSPYPTPHLPPTVAT